MKEENYYKTIDLPHLRATIYFMDLSKLKGIPHQGSAYTCIIDETDELKKEKMWLSIGIFYSNIEKAVKKIAYMPMIFHEIIHALQILCKERIMKFENEEEHFAYITSYILEELLSLTPTK